MPSPLPLMQRRGPLQLYIIGVVSLLATAFTVWFFGFDIAWSVSVASVLTTTGVLITRFAFDDGAGWPERPAQALRGTRLATSTLEQALTATDRLARPQLARSLRAVVINERDDHLARTQLLRHVRTLIGTEARRHGLDPAQQPAQVAKLFGEEAVTVLQSHNHAVVTTATIARCLDAMTRAAHTSPEMR